MNRDTAVLIVESGAVRIEVSTEAAQKLEAITRTGIAAIPKKGLEVGGLLFGDITESPPVVRISDIREVPIEYRTGPTFRVTRRDLDMFRVAATLEQSSPHRPLGHFRSHLRGAVEVTEDDRVLADSVPGARFDWMMLIGASKTDPSQAHFYQRTNSGWNCVMRTPLIDGGTSDASAAKAITPVAPRVPAPPPANRGEWLTNRISDLSASFGSLRSHFALWISLGCCLTILAVALLLQRTGRGPQQSFELRLQPVAAGVMVQWSRDHELIRKSQGGVLHITDGSRSRQIDLSPEELKSGAIMYQPEGTDVVFRLEVTVNESLPAVVRSMRFVRQGSQAGAKGGEVATYELRVEPPQLAPPAAPPPEAEETPPAEPRRRFSRPVIESAPPPVILAPPPVLQPGNVLDLSSTKLPSATVTVPPIQFVAAVPVRKIEPGIPRNARHLIREEITVEVRVKIDSLGNVTDAAPAGFDDVAEQILGLHSAQAARLWKFRPALVHGKPVESEMNLRFRFSKPDR